MDKTSDDAWDYLEDLVKKAQTWYCVDPGERVMFNQSSESFGKFSLNEHNAIESRIAQLVQKLDKLELKGAQEVKVVRQFEEAYFICETLGHSTDACPTIPALKNHSNQSAPRDINAINQQFDLFSQTYNQGLRQNPAF